MKKVYRLVRGVHIHGRIRLLLAAGLIYGRSTARAAAPGGGHARRVVLWCWCCVVCELFLRCVRDSYIVVLEKKQFCWGSVRNRYIQNRSSSGLMSYTVPGTGTYKTYMVACVDVVRVSNVLHVRLPVHVFVDIVTVCTAQELAHPSFVAQALKTRAAELSPIAQALKTCADVPSPIPQAFKICADELPLKARTGEICLAHATPVAHPGDR